MALIEVEKVSKKFKRQKRKEGLWAAMRSLVRREYEIKTAVEDISFSVDKGEIVGYIGPNGAGKSTTIKILSGILVPSSGRASIGGLVPYENRIENAKRIGVVFGQRTQLWWDVPIAESFNLMRYMYRIPMETYKSNLKLFIEILGLGDFMNVSVRHLSLGQRMRADLCAALLHNPQILFLDEPTIGLDVVVKENIRIFIKEINQRYETTVILTTHDMSDIEKLSSRVIVIDKGRIMYDHDLNGLKALYGSLETISVRLLTDACDSKGLYALGVVEVKAEKENLIISYDRRVVNSSTIIKYLMDTHEIGDFRVYETDIEKVIRNMYKSLGQERGGGEKA
jgi:ABC-2 type transport system ATP-binding protein